jgi:hypothetical protein
MRRAPVAPAPLAQVRAVIMRCLERYRGQIVSR